MSRPATTECPVPCSPRTKRSRAGTMCLSMLVAGALTLGVCQGSGSAAEAHARDRQPDLASQVRAVFSAKCAGCHGADLRRPRGRFGYVLDLERLAANPKLVVPSDPDGSKLWTLIRDEEMPPEGGAAGPLSPGEKEVVRAWIASGAPAAAPEPPPDTSPSTVPVAAGKGGTPRKPLSARRVLGWLGKFHILVVHFPIALLLAAAAGELWCVWRRNPEPWTAVRFCVLLGAGGAAAAVVLGWLDADFGGYGAGAADVLCLHRWIGTGAGVWAVATALLS
jgi:Planctomycete cytochrome C